MHIYTVMLKGTFTPSGPETYIGAAQLVAASKQSMYAGTHFTDPGRMES